MCRVSERYLSGQTTFLNILSIWAQKNGSKSTILNLILTNLHRIHGRIVVHACVEYMEEIVIGVRDIHPDQQNYQIFCQFKKTKMAINRPFWIWSRRNFTGFMVNACVEYQEEILIGVGDIHLDGQHFSNICQFEQTKTALSWLVWGVNRWCAI